MSKIQPLEFSELEVVNGITIFCTYTVDYNLRDNQQKKLILSVLYVLLKRTTSA